MRGLSCALPPKFHRVVWAGTVLFFYRTLDMKKSLNTVLVLGLFLFAGCNTGSTTQQNTVADTKNAGQQVASINVQPSSPATSSGGLYFDFTVDGKEMHVAEDDVLTTYDEISGNKIFKIFAGKDGETSLVVTIPQDMTKASTTPSGSTDYDDNITQGSVSLQNYPEKNYTSNSFDTNSAETSVPVADAVVVTSSEKTTGEERVIIGTINVKTFGGDNSSNDPNVKDHVITGKFKVTHDFSGFGI